MNAVFLALRSPLLRDVVNRLLTDSGITVSGEAYDLESALECLRSRSDVRPDIIIIDAAFCNEDSDAVRLVRQSAGQARIVILAYDTDLNAISSDHIMTVDGVLTFGITSEAMIDSLRLIQKGERVVPRELMHALLARAAEESAEGAPKAVPVPRQGRSQAPSPRETEILQHLLQGDSNKMIARELGITEATVKVHLKGLLRKISASNRTQAAIWALNNGYNIVAAPVSSAQNHRGETGDEVTTFAADGGPHTRDR